MQQNATFKWTGAREDAALAVAQDEQTEDEIAASVGIERTTLWRWKKHPAFHARVQEHLATFRTEVKARGIADVQNRVDAANDRWGRMKRLMDARADQYKDIPGGDTGLLVATPMLVKTFAARPTVTPSPDGPPIIGEVLEPQKQAEIIYEYAFDRALMAEVRAHEDHAAKQLGQLVEKREDKLDATDDFFAALRAFGKAASP